MLEVREDALDQRHCCILYDLQGVHEGETVIEYGWKPQLVSPPELTQEEISTLKRGKSVEGDFGLKLWDLFLLESSVAICYYSAVNECWIRMMTDEETLYLKTNQEDRKC